jgi:DNA modification methylase
MRISYRGGVDARHLPLDDESIDAVITSPPYFGLRSYGGDERELGRAGLEEYLEDTVAWTDEVMRVMKPTGTFWLNIGDTANGSGGAGGDYNRGGRKHGSPRYRQGATPIEGSQWLLVPHRVALSLQERGWLVRSWITWDKGVRRPESAAHVRRPGVQTEVILMLVKDKSYKFFPEALTEDAGDVWRFPPAKGNGHLAPFPAELVRRCLLLSTEKDDVVLDPFVGSGTTLDVCLELDRSCFGYDLYEFSPGLGESDLNSEG